MKSQLEQYYLATTYSVFINEQQYDIKIGKPVPPDINQLLEKEKFAVILTAWNPRSKSLSSEENKVRNNKLYSNLKNNYYTVFNALGQGNDSVWSAEESFFILGINKEDAEQIAVDYGQYAYVWFSINKAVSLVFSAIWYE